MLMPRLARSKSKSVSGQISISRSSLTWRPAYMTGAWFFGDFHG
jgi:hypothetical protein